MLQILQRIIAVILSSFSVFSTFIGGLSFEEYDVFKNIAYGEAERVINLVSPTAYVTKDTVPSVLAYGGTDMIVPSGNAERIKDAFENAGAVHNYILYPLSNHGLGLDPLCEMEYINTVEQYCVQYFGY